MAGKSPEEEHPVKTFGYAAKDPSGVLSPFKFSRRYIYIYICILRKNLMHTVGILTESLTTNFPENIYQ